MFNRISEKTDRQPGDWKSMRPRQNVDKTATEHRRSLPFDLSVVEIIFYESKQFAVTPASQQAIKRFKSFAAKFLLCIKYSDAPTARTTLLSTHSADVVQQRISTDRVVS